MRILSYAPRQMEYNQTHLGGDGLGADKFNSFSTIQTYLNNSYKCACFFQPFHSSQLLSPSPPRRGRKALKAREKLLMCLRDLEEEEEGGKKTSSQLQKEKLDLRNSFHPNVKKS